MYLAILLISLIFAFIAYCYPKLDDIFFKVEILVMTLFLCFRYGQGTDYFQYERMYDQNMVGVDWHWLFNNTVHGEMGYKILEGIFKSWGVPFVGFFGVMSLVAMICTYNGIKKYSFYKTLSVALLVPTFYFSYYIGIVREGICLAVVLGILIPLYIDKKYVKYCLGVVLLCGIHKYAFILFLPLLIELLRLLKSKKLQIIMAIMVASILGVVLYVFNINAGYIHFSPSYGAIILRIILFYIITKLYRCLEPVNEIDERLYSFYTVGFVLYISTCPIAFVSHRMAAYMKIAEIVLLPRLIRQIRGEVWLKNMNHLIIRWKHSVIMLLLCILMVEGVKNIDSYIGQGGYYEFVNIYNYPYVTIFNQEDIYIYRYDEVGAGLEVLG